MNTFISVVTNYLFLLFLLSNVTVSQWIRTNLRDSGPVRSLVTIGSTIYAATDSAGILRSTDQGNSWVKVSTGLIYSPDTWINAIFGSEQKMFAGTFGAGAFISTDKGNSWNNIPTLTTINNNIVYSFANNQTNYFAGNINGLYISSNGTTWTRTSNIGLTYSQIISLVVNGSNIFAGTPNGVYKSTNNGTNWTPINSGISIGGSNFFIAALTMSGTSLFAGTRGGGIFLSTNNGSNWNQVNSGLENLTVNSFAVDGVNIFAGTDAGVFLSTDNGTIWSAVNSGWNWPYLSSIMTLCISDNYLFAGNWSYGIWRRPLSEMVTDINDKNVKSPAKFDLIQNYPNPFNPSTKINYALPQNSFVELKVFNLLGQEIATLVNQEKAAGNYEVNFNASNLPSGVYIYKMKAVPNGRQAGDPSTSSGQGYVETRKMILLK